MGTHTYMFGNNKYKYVLNVVCHLSKLLVHKQILFLTLFSYRLIQCSASETTRFYAPSSKYSSNDLQKLLWKSYANALPSTHVT